MAAKVKPIPECYHSVTPYLIFDRAAEARQKGLALAAKGVAIHVDPTALDRFAEAVAARTAGDG